MSSKLLQNNYIHLLGNTPYYFSLYFLYIAIHILPLKKSQKMRSDILPVYRYYHYKYIFQSKDHIWWISKFYYSDITRRITGSKLLTILTILGIQTASVLHSCHHMKRIKHICCNYDYINKKSHFWRQYILHSKNNTNTPQLQQLFSTVNTQKNNNTKV
jgi:hypothetical protein